MTATSNKGLSLFFPFLVACDIALGAFLGLTASALVGGRFSAPGSISTRMDDYWLVTVPGVLLGLLSTALAKAFRRGAPGRPQLQLGLSALVVFVAALLQGSAEEFPPQSVF